MTNLLHVHTYLPYFLKENPRSLRPTIKMSKALIEASYLCISKCLVDPDKVPFGSDSELM